MITENLAILAAKKNNLNIIRVAQIWGREFQMDCFTMKWSARKNGGITFNSHKNKTKPMTIRFGALYNGVFMLQWKISLLPQQSEVLDE